MAATITDIIKREILDFIFDQTQNIGVSQGDSDRFYIGISRSTEWDSDVEPPIPNPSDRERLNFQTSLQSVKEVTDISYVVQRYNWSSGGVYYAWDDSYHTNTDAGPTGDIPGPYYVITDDNNVYICVQQGRETGTGLIRNSTFKPTDVTGAPFAAGPDGYVWKFLFNVGTFGTRRFLSTEYFPVQKVLDSGQTVSEIQQKAIQDSAVPGEIVGIAVDSGGVGFTSKPTISIVGDGSSAAAFARIDNQGRIYEVIMKADSTQPNSKAGFSFGTNYTNASISVTGGGGEKALLRPIISPALGIADDPRRTLNATSIMFNTRLEGPEGEGDFITSNDFRQIGLIRNPLKDSASEPGFVGDSALSSETAFAFKRLYLINPSLTPENIPGDQIVKGVSSGAAAVIDKYDDQNQIFFVHQNLETGYTDFNASETVQVFPDLFSTGAIGSATLSGDVSASGSPLRTAEVDNFSGDVLFIDNRSPIRRDNEQTEDIKIVIQL